MKSPWVWDQHFEVRAYEVDLRGRLATGALCDWLQEAAGQHARALGWAMEELPQRGLTWVLSRLHLRLSGRPECGAVIRLQTWPFGVRRLYAVRDFRACDGEGGEVAVATSGWLLLNLTSRRPIRPPAELETLAASAPGRALEDEFAHLPSAEQGEPVARFTTRFSDLDVNRHANNAALLRMVLDGMPAAVLLGTSPSEVEVEFRAEVGLGEILEARIAAAEKGEGAYLHSLVRSSDGYEVLRARTRWVPDTEPV